MHTYLQKVLEAESSSAGLPTRLVIRSQAKKVLELVLVRILTLLFISSKHKHVSKIIKIASFLKLAAFDDECMSKKDRKILLG